VQRKDMAVGKIANAIRFPHKYHLSTTCRLCPKSFGTCNGCILRSNNLRGKSDTQIVLRNCIDYPGCDIYYSWKQYYDTFGTVQEVVPTIAFEAYKKIDSTGCPSDRRNTSFTTSSPLSLSTFHKSERYFCILFAASIRLARMDNQI